MENTDTQNQTTDEDDTASTCSDRLQESYDNFERRRIQKEHIGNLVFSLRKSITSINESKDIPFADIMENNARALNAAFEYYLDNASKSPDGDRKINLALRSHAQMVRAINTWERLRTSKNEGTN